MSSSSSSLSNKNNNADRSSLITPHVEKAITSKRRSKQQHASFSSAVRLSTSSGSGSGSSSSSSSQISRKSSLSSSSSSSSSTTTTRTPPSSSPSSLSLSLSLSSSSKQQQQQERKKQQRQRQRAQQHHQRNQQQQQEEEETAEERQRQGLSHVGEHPWDYGKVPIYLTKFIRKYVFCAAINSCNLGYDIGISGAVGNLLQNEYDLSNWERDLFIGSLHFWSIFGALFAYYFSDTFGRRSTFLLSSLLILFGIGIILLTTTLATSSTIYDKLLIGRMFIGLGVGSGLTIDPLYITEIAPAKGRGELVNWSEIGLNVGLVLGFTVGLYVSEDVTVTATSTSRSTSSLRHLLLDDPEESSSSWRLMFLIGSILPLFMIYLVLFILPESPRWLLLQNTRCQGHPPTATATATAASRSHPPVSLTASSSSSSSSFWGNKMSSCGWTTPLSLFSFSFSTNDPVVVEDTARKTLRRLYNRRINSDQVFDHIQQSHFRDRVAIKRMIRGTRSLAPEEEKDDPSMAWKVLLPHRRCSCPSPTLVRSSSSSSVVCCVQQPLVNSNNNNNPITPAINRMILIGVLLAIAQQMVGYDAIQYYLLDALNDTGIPSEHLRSQVMILLSVVKISFIVIGGKASDIGGRKRQLYISLLGMTISLLVLATIFTSSSEKYNSSSSSRITLIGLSLYLSFYSLGMGPCSYLIPNEIFPTILRAKAMSLWTGINRIMATIMYLSFISQTSWFTWTQFYVVFACLCICVAILVYLWIPETKGRSLEDITLFMAETTNDTHLVKVHRKVVQRYRNNSTRTQPPTANNGSFHRSNDKDTVVDANNGYGIEQPLLDLV